MSASSVFTPLRAQVVGVVAPRVHSGMDVHVQGEWAGLREGRNVCTVSMWTEHEPAVGGDGGTVDVTEAATVAVVAWLAMHCTAKFVFCFIVF